MHEPSPVGLPLLLAMARSRSYSGELPCCEYQKTNPFETVVLGISSTRKRLELFHTNPPSKPAHDAFPTDARRFSTTFGVRQFTETSDAFHDNR